MRYTVAIDGPAAAGKGTIARAVADTLGFGHLDTGLLYRAVGKKMLAGQDPVEAARALIAEDLSDDTVLRGAPVAQAASKVAAIPAVREALVDFQRAFARRLGGAVLDGRDIGTVICPEAEVKFFITASEDTRADRRHEELLKRGDTVTRDEVLAEMRRRDARDAERSVAPLVAAEDAVELDTSALTVDEAVEQVLAMIEARQPVGSTD